MPHILEWKCSYYSLSDGKWLYGKIKLHQKFLRFKCDAGKLRVPTFSIDLRNVTDVKRRTTNLFYNAVVVTEHGLHHHCHWFSSLENVYGVINIIEHFRRASLLGSLDGSQRGKGSKKQAKNELLEIAYDSQKTLMSSAVTLHSQGEQIRDSIRKMDLLNSDLEIGERIVNDMESWFGYWKVPHRKPSEMKGHQFHILLAKTQNESHSPSKIVLASNSVNIFTLEDKELYTFHINDLRNTLVHSPYEVEFVQRKIGKADLKAHVISTELPDLLRCIQRVYKTNLSFENTQLASSDEDDEIEDEVNDCGNNTSNFAASSSNRDQLFDDMRKEKYGCSDTTQQSQALKQKQQKVLSESEANELSGVIKSMKEMALDIQCEQDVQNKQLDRLGLCLEKADAKVKKDNQVIRSMLRK